MEEEHPDGQHGKHKYDRQADQYFGVDGPLLFGRYIDHGDVDVQQILAVGFDNLAAKTGVLAFGHPMQRFLTIRAICHGST